MRSPRNLLYGGLVIALGVFGAVWLSSTYTPPPVELQAPDGAAIRAEGRAHAHQGPASRVPAKVILYAGSRHPIDHPGCKGTPMVCHDVAGGRGTWANPVSASVRPGGFSVGSRLYVPALRVYVIVEDDCRACQQRTIAVWAGSRLSTDCTAALVAAVPVPVLLHPKPALPVGPTPLTERC